MLRGKVTKLKRETTKGPEVEMRPRVGCAWFGEKGRRERVRGGREAWPDLEGNEAFERSAKKIKIK